MNPKTFTSIAFVCFFLILISCRPSQENKKFSQESLEPFELEGLSIQTLQQKLASGEYTSREITQLYLDRIRQLDHDGPRLNAVIELNPEALQIASQMDKERQNNQLRGPLHGIPILIKDNIDTHDKMLTTTGSLAMLNNKPLKDAFLVEKLRSAGAIILGKTNLSEWSNFRSDRSISGWSSRGGQTKNPYVLDQSPCGSSSGSAVAVAADYCLAAVGTETDGSLACPASMNGVVGIKPTVGLISRTGIIPISKTQDTPGPIARTVMDAAILLSVMAGFDPLDAATHRAEGKVSKDYASHLRPGGLKGKRIGVEKSMLRQESEIGHLLSLALEQMQKEGAIIIEVEFAQAYTRIAEAEYEVLKYEFKDGVNAYLKTSNGPIKSIDDVIRYNNENTANVMPLFGQELMQDANSKEGLDSKAYKDALIYLQDMRNYIDKVLTDHTLDVLCGVGSGAYSPAAVTGYPSITVPMGLSNELPVGLTFFGRPFDEERLLSIAYGFEQSTKKRTAPKFLPTATTGL
jgi:amidase